MNDDSDINATRHARALVGGEFRPGDRVTADADPVSGALVFSSERATVVADAGERRDARSAGGVADGAAPTAAAAGPGGGRGYGDDRIVVCGDG